LIPCSSRSLTPLAVALAIALGLPKRFSVKLAYAGFAVPALLALHCWYHFPANAGADYAFLTHTRRASTLGIGLKLGLNGIALPLFVLAGLVGLAAGLYAIQSAGRAAEDLPHAAAHHAGRPDGRLRLAWTSSSSTSSTNSR
jgi:NADH:ubiquinone oxidoreductase subunit 4 (subunit M)